MEPNTLAFLISLSNIEGFGGPNWQLADMSVKLDTYKTLGDSITHYPGFALDDFRTRGYQRTGELALYVSEDVRKYLFQGIGNPNDQGIIIVFVFEPRNLPIDSLKNKSKEALHYLLRLEGLEEDAAKNVLSYVDSKSG